LFEHFSLSARFVKKSLGMRKVTPDTLLPQHARGAKRARFTMIVRGDRKWEGSMQNGLRTSNAGAEADRGFPMRFENHIEDRMIGRRDMLVGLWAGTQLGLPKESRAIYALEVMAAGLMEPRPDDVVDKIMHDFSTKGIPITRGQILVQLSKIHRLVDATSSR
jgi:hypothetical protein